MQASELSPELWSAIELLIRDEIKAARPTVQPIATAPEQEAQMSEPNVQAYWGDPNVQVFKSLGWDNGGSFVATVEQQPVRLSNEEYAATITERITAMIKRLLKPLKTGD